jgi:hypothetical protein
MVLPYSAASSLATGKNNLMSEQGLETWAIFKFEFGFYVATALGGVPLAPAVAAAAAANYSNYSKLMSAASISYPSIGNYRYSPYPLPSLVSKVLQLNKEIFFTQFDLPSLLVCFIVFFVLNTNANSVLSARIQGTVNLRTFCKPETSLICLQSAANSNTIQSLSANPTYGAYALPTSVDVSSLQNLDWSGVYNSYV